MFASIPRRARIPASNRQAHCGRVTFVQRISDAFNLDLHFHTLALDGPCVEGGQGELVFRIFAYLTMLKPSLSQTALIGPSRESCRCLGPQDDPGRGQAEARRTAACRTVRRIEFGEHRHGPLDRQALRECGRCDRRRRWFPALGPVLCDRCGLQLPGRCPRSSPGPHSAGMCGEKCPPPSAGYRTAVACARRQVALPSQTPLARWETYIICEPLGWPELPTALGPPPRFNLTRYFVVPAPAAAFWHLIVAIITGCIYDPAANDTT